MSSVNFEGTGVALVTPFNGKGEVDFDALSKLITHVIEGGVNYLVALGTTSEAPTLNKNEKREVLNHIREVNSGSLPLVVGMGGNDTGTLVNSIESAQWDGIDAVLSVTPYYNKPSQDGIATHFKSIADVSPVPVILYNVPARTSSNISADTTLKLSQHSNIIGIKEASGDFEQCALIAASCPSDFLLISGEDLLTVPLLSIGGKGAISVIANAFPDKFAQMVQDYLHGDLTRSLSVYHQLVPFFGMIFEEGNPTGVKTLLKNLGLCDDSVRLPLMAASERLSDKIGKELRKFRA